MRIVIILVCSLVCSCSSTRTVKVDYQASTDRSTYETAKILLGYRDFGGGFATGQRITIRARAFCQGKNCVPDEIALVFYNDSHIDLNIDYHRILIKYDEETVDWEFRDRLVDYHFQAVPPGEFIRVTFPRNDFIRFAEASNVSVDFALGSGTYSLPYGRRSPLRELAETMK